MAAGANADVLTLVAQAKGFDATGKSIDKVNKELLDMLGPLGKITKLDIESMLSKTGRRAGDAVGTLKVLAEILDKNNNKFIITAQRVGETGNQYELLATKVKKSVDVITEADRKAAKEAEKAQRQRERAVDRAIAASERDEKRAAKLAADAANRAARQPDVVDINRQLGGFKGGMTNAGMLAIDRANKNLLDLLSKSNVSTPRLNQIFVANQKNDRSVLNSLSEGEQKVSIALRRLSAAFDQASSAGQRTQNVLIGFRGMMRLLEVQTLHSVISGLSSYFQQASEKSIELTGHIAAIQTISQKAQQSTEDWRDALVRLSNAYGFDVIDVAKAGYEAISNQIAKGAAVTPFLAQAFEFARATSSSAAESVDLLSSALNGYGLSAESVQKISAILFKTIDLGRVKASELANILGNSTPIASALGISFEELMAGLSTLTIQGIRTDTALTLMNNIMLKLMKPTKGMQELFDKWGVSSGEVAIKTFGLIGFLERLGKEAEKGGIAAIAADLSDMRAIRAVEGFLSNDSLETYKKNLAEITKGQKEYANSVDITAQAMQTKLAVEFQKLNNLFVSNVGFRKNAMFMSLIQQVGGLDKAVEGFAEGMLSTTHILMQVAVPLININTGLEKFNVGISKLAPTLLTAGAAYLFFFRTGNMVSGILPLLSRGIQNTTSVAHPAALAITALGEKTGLVSRQALFGNLQFTAFASKLANIAAVSIPALIGAFSYLIAIQEEEEQRIANSGNMFLSSLSESNIEASKLLQEAIQEMNKEVEEGFSANLRNLNLYNSVLQSKLNAVASSSNGILSRFSVDAFEESLIGKTVVPKLALISKRFEEIQGHVENLFDARKFKEAEKPIEDLIELTKKFREEQRKVREEIEKVNRELKNKGEDKQLEYKLFNKSDRKKIKAYSAASASAEAEALAAFNKNDLEEASKLIDRAIQLREKSMSISENLVTTNKYGKPKGLPEYLSLLDFKSNIQTKLGESVSMEDRGNKMLEQSTKLHDIAQENIKNMSVIKSDLDEINSLSETLKSNVQKLQSEKARIFDDLRASLSEFGKNVTLLDERSYKVKNAKAIYGASGFASNESFDKLIALYEKLETQGASFGQGLKDFTDPKDMPKIIEKYNTVKSTLTDINKLWLDINDQVEKSNKKNFTQLAPPLEAFTFGEGTAKHSMGDLLNSSLKRSEASDLIISKDTEVSKQLIEKLDALEKANNLFNESNQKLEILLKEKLPDAYKEATEAIKRSTEATEKVLDRLDKSVKKNLLETEKLLSQPKNLAPTPKAGNALGGLLGGGYGGAFAGGGFIDGPLGRDNLFIRAHAGEFVVNAEAAQRFYPQLTAMNSMYTAAPNYNSGGPITQVGDIHINANLTGKTDVDVVALGKQLRREIKRGTVRLN